MSEKTVTLIRSLEARCAHRRDRTARPGYRPSVSRPSRLAAATVTVAILTAACSDSNDDDRAVAPVESGAPSSASAAVTTAPSATTASQSATTSAPSTTAAQTTAPAVEPVSGGTLSVSGESEVANPWTPAAMQCDSYC